MTKQNPSRTSCRSLAAGVVLALGALMLAPASSEGAPVERLEIVDRAIAFHGGELYTRSETELDVCSRSGCFHLRARLDGDLFEYEVTGKSGDRERRALWSNEKLQVWHDDRADEVGPDTAQRYRDWVNARIYFPFLPFRLNDPSVLKEDLGLETWDGRSLHKVKVTFVAGSSTDATDVYLYWFDPESGRVEQFAYSFDENGGGMRFRRARNYRRVGGLLFFDQENLGVDGAGFTVDQITPRFVEKKLRPISVVRFEQIEVRPLGEAVSSAHSDEHVFRSKIARIELAKPADWHFQDLESVAKHRASARLKDEDLQQAVVQLASAPLVVATKYPEPHPSLNPSFQLLVRPLGQLVGISAKAILEMVRPTLERSFEDFELVEDITLFELDGLSAARMTATYTVETQDGAQFPARATLITVPRDFHMYQLSFSAPPEGPDALGEEIAEILGSVRFLS